MVSVISMSYRLPLEERRGYTNVFNALARIAREEGVGTLWRVCISAMYVW